jgi:cytochrome c oxidase subunit I
MTDITADFAPAAAPVATNYLNDGTTLWSWLTTTDHKRIGILYALSITFFFFIGGIAIGIVRLELLTPQADVVSAETYNRLFSLHGIIMVWFFLVPSIPATLGNFLLPMMIGARDVAFPRLNLLSWYLYLGGHCSRCMCSSPAASILGGRSIRRCRRITRPAMWLPRQPECL